MKKNKSSAKQSVEFTMPPLVEVPDHNVGILLTILDRVYKEGSVGAFLEHAFPITDHLPDQLRVLGFQGDMLVYPIKKWLQFYYQDYPDVISFQDMMQLNTLFDNPLAILGNDNSPQLIQVVLGLKSPDGQTNPVIIQVDITTNECEFVLE